MRALVTGATGFLGRRLAEALRAKGIDVTATGRNARTGAELARAGLRFEPADLGDAAAVQRLARGQDIVFHSAALSSPWGTYREFFDANVVGTRHVVRACLESGARLVHVSTPSVYVAKHDRYDVREDEPLPDERANDYAATKLLAEIEVDRAVKEGLHAVILRPQGIYGPGDTTIFPRVLKVGERGAVPLIDGGHAQIDLTYVDDVVAALLCAMDHGGSFSGRKYNVTSGDPHPIRHAMETLFRAVDLPFRAKEISFRKAYALATMLEVAHRTILRGKEPRLTRYTVVAMGKSRTLNIDAARRDLKYEPRVKLTEGIQQFARWWRESRGHSAHSIS
jgi:nucleoside-diphosphate-sugar epimerase